MEAPPVYEETSHDSPVASAAAAASATSEVGRSKEFCSSVKQEAK
jgi:hypothetical protein